MSIKQISVFVENKSGRLAEITEVIGNAGVDIRALSIADTSDFGILRLIVDDPEKTYEALKTAGFTVSLTDVIAICVSDEPGAFSKAVRIMSDANISIEYMYAFISRTDDKAFIILRIDDVEKGAAVLKEKGIDLISDKEIYSL